MIKDLKDQFEQKYLEERKIISLEKEVDMGVATWMLIAHVQNRDINTIFKYNFTGCENLDYETMDNEIVELLKVPEGLE